MYRPFDEDELRRQIFETMALSKPKPLHSQAELEQIIECVNVLGPFFPGASHDEILMFFAAVPEDRCDDIIVPLSFAIN
jgi:hypothetical protein